MLSYSKEENQGVTTVFTQSVGGDIVAISREARANQTSPRDHVHLLSLKGLLSGHTEVWYHDKVGYQTIISKDSVDNLKGLFFHLTDEMQQPKITASIPAQIASFFKGFWPSGAKPLSQP